MFIFVWNQFEDHTTSAFSLIYDEKNFCDVTLVTDDGETLLAHKAVFSEVRPILKAILSGMNGQSVDSILRCIYLGEINVKSENIEKFLELGSRWKLKGMSEPLLDYHDEIVANEEVHDRQNIHEFALVENVSDVNNLISCRISCQAS